MRELDIPDNSGYTPPHQHHSMPVIDENSVRNFQTKLDQSFANASDEDREAEERAYIAAREASRRGIKEKITDGAKRRIEMLLGLVQTTREVVIENNVFILRSLKSKEMREAMIAAFDFDGTVQAPYEMRKQLLARSLTHVAGIEIEQFIGSSSLDSKFAFIDELDENLSNRLYDEYVKLSNSAKEKYSVKTAEDMKEVVEDIKK
jgi:hypothetical protein